jgi:hypothetical protein
LIITSYIWGKSIICGIIKTISGIKKALKEDSPERIAARRKKVEMDTWERKAQVLLDELFGKRHTHSGAAGTKSIEKTTSGITP